MYEQQILKILSLVDERGISISSLTMHIYNQNSTFFAQPDLLKIRQYVRQFLARHSKSPHSLIERAEKRGYYRLNKKASKDARQLLLQFEEFEQETQQEEKKKEPSPDLSLSLFDDF